MPEGAAVGEGTFEVERRYLVRVRSGLWDELAPGWRLRQGYLGSGPPSVRVRVGEPRGPVLTVKSGSGVRRREVEALVPGEIAEALFGLAGDRVIEKARHPLGRWVLDRFGGGLDGLALLEIELDAEDDPLPEPPEGVEILREVTYDNSFTSNGLASMTVTAQRTFVAMVYGEAGA